MLAAIIRLAAITGSLILQTARLSLVITARPIYSATETPDIYTVNSQVSANSVSSIEMANSQGKVSNKAKFNIMPPASF